MAIVNRVTGHDLVYGGDGADEFSTGGGKDTVYGGGGNDWIDAGGGDDNVYGGDGNDEILAGGGDDSLEGGLGDDVLDGQGGADVFVFNFKVGLSSGSVTFAGFDPGEDGKLQENELNQQYQQFLAENGIMVPDGEGGYEFADGYSWHRNDEDDALWGSDGPMSEIITYDNGQGGKEQIRYYEGTLVREQVLSVTESEGHDTIKSLQNAGPNVDKIELNGLGDLNIDELDLLFDLELVDTNGDSIADASRLVWGDGMGSITIEGNTQWGTDVRAFFGDTDQVLLL